MNNQLDRIAAEQARDEAINRVERNADADWLDYAYKAVKYLAENRDEFTTDDVWLVLADWGYSVREPRALGAVMRRAAKNDLIQATTRYKKSNRKECHRNPKMVWITQLVQPDDPFMCWDGESDVSFL